MSPWGGREEFVAVEELQFTSLYVERFVLVGVRMSNWAATRRNARFDHTDRPAGCRCPQADRIDVTREPGPRTAVCRGSSWLLIKMLIKNPLLSLSRSQAVLKLQPMLIPESARVGYRAF
jgi:hypothetical protein